MKKEELKQFMKDIDACKSAKKKFSKSKATPSEFWKMIHPAWMIYLLDELANGPFFESDYETSYEWHEDICDKLDLEDVGPVGLLYIKEWSEKEAKRVRKRILKLYPWKKIKKKVMKNYRWYRANKTE